MIAVMINLKTYNHLPEVRGIPAECWCEQEREAGWGNSRHNRGRDKRRFDDYQVGQGRGMTPHKETHPMIKKMMEPYYKQYKKISGNMICRAAGTHVGELKLQGACLHHILAGCVGSWGR